MTLPGESETITVEPVEVPKEQPAKPEQPQPQPDRQPDKEKEPVKQYGGIWMAPVGTPWPDMFVGEPGVPWIRIC